MKKRHDDTEGDEAPARMTQVAQPASGDQPDLEEKEGEHTTERVFEERGNLRRALLAGEESDGQAAHEEDDRFAGDQFAQDLLHASAARRDGRFADQENGENDRRDFHHREQCGDVRLIGHLGELEESKCLAESHGRDRPLVRGQDRGVHVVEPSKLSHEKVTPDRDGKAEEKGRGERLPEFAEGHTVEVGPTLQPDGEKEIDGHGRVNLGRNLQIAFDQTGHHAKQKGEDHRGKQAHQ